MLQLEVAKKVTAKLRSEARRMFPRESFSALLGRAIGGGFEITDVWIPPDLKKYSTAKYVWAPDHWAVESNSVALDEGLIVVGCAHSHPVTFEESLTYGNLLSRIVAPSLGDWECEWKNVSAITAIIEERFGKLKTMTQFFGPAVSCKTKVIDGKDQ